MADWNEVSEAISTLEGDGDTVTLEGFTHPLRYAAGHEITRQGKRNLALGHMTSDVIYDQFVGVGCARSFTLSRGGNPGVDCLHRLRDAIERDWPRPLARLRILRPDPIARGLTVTHLHPGCNRAKVIARTGWPLKFEEQCATSEVPTETGRAVLRHLHRRTAAAQRLTAEDA